MQKIVKSNLRLSCRCRVDSRGFTLVEMLVIVTLIVILGAVGSIVLMKMEPNIRLKAATHVLYSDLQKAKMHAVKTNNDVTFSFTAVAGCDSDTSYTFIDEDGVEIVNTVMDNGVCIYSSDFVATSGFDPRGLALDMPAGKEGATVKLKHLRTSREYEITQSLAGNVKIQ